MELCLLFPTYIHGMHRTAALIALDVPTLHWQTIRNRTFMASAFNACLFYITDQSNDFRRYLSAECNMELSIKSGLYTKCTTLIS